MTINDERRKAAARALRRGPYAHDATGAQDLIADLLHWIRTADPEGDPREYLERATRNFEAEEAEEAAAGLYCPDHPEATTIERPGERIRCGDCDAIAVPREGR